MDSSGAAPSPARRLACLGAVAALGVATYWTFRLGYADFLFHRDSTAAVTRAAEIAPGDAQYRARLAALDPSRRLSALRETVALNPYDSGAWIELGLQAEMSQDFQTAEKSLLKAAEVDETYEPRWTLANYYFRRNTPDRFWFWGRKAAEMAYQDQTALFDLYWRMSQDPRAILQRGIPDRPAILAQYLAYLVRSERLDAAAPVAERLVSQNDPNRLDVLLAYCDRLLAAGQVDDALRAWNSLSINGLIDSTKLAPEAGQSLTNGDFQAVPLLHGFDWRTAQVPGTILLRTESPQGLRISFSGRQPERCTLIEQFVPLLPSREYRLRFRYRTSGVEPGSGLRWKLTGAGNNSGFSAASTDLSHDGWTEGAFDFSIPSEVRLGRLALTYERVPGTVRIEGSVSLANLVLELSR